MAKYLVMLAGALALSVGGLSAAMAKGVAGHSRVHEVDARLLDQQRRIDAGVAQGHIGAHAAVADSARDARVARQLSLDEAANAGHVTRAEYRQLNRELDRNSADIYGQRHR